jgi:serine protease Do
MIILRKFLVIVLGIVLIAGVVYIITISYKAQQERDKAFQEKEAPFLKEETKPLDTAQYIIPEPDAHEKEVPSVPTPKVPPETLRWRSLENGELPKLQGRIPFTNPNLIFIAAAERILPAVVTIRSEISISNIPKDGDHHFFWERDDEEEDQPDFFRRGNGSGIIISPDGYILTNYHVIERASSFSIVLLDKREFDGQFIGGDPNTDVALLKINGANFQTAYIGNSDSVRIGEWVMAVGSPLTFTSTITAGIVSALGRNIRIIDTQYSIENFIQTDAVINPGNSGGALVNLNGEVIGINTAIATRTGLYQGYGFAIPINFAIKIVNDILQYGEVRRGLLGVSISNVDNRVAKGVGLPHPTGVLVQGIQTGQAAEKAGLQAGDIILRVNGEEVNSVNDLQVKIASKPPGETVLLKIWRNKRELTIRVKLGQAPVDRSTSWAGENNRQKSYKNLGMEIRDLNRDERNRLDLEGGIMVSDVKMGSPAHKGSIFPGYIITKIDNREIEDKKGFEKILKGYDKGDVIKLTARPPNSRGSLNERILFVEIE